MMTYSEFDDRDVDGSEYDDGDSDDSEFDDGDGDIVVIVM